MFVLTQTVTTSALSTLITPLSIGHIPPSRPGSHSSGQLTTDIPVSPLPSRAAPPLRGTPSHGHFSYLPSSEDLWEERQPGFVRRARSCLTAAHTHCRQSAFTCDGKDMLLRTEGDGMHLHNTHINTNQANTYADILNTNKEHTLTPISASNTERGWENNELGSIRK